MKKAALRFRLPFALFVLAFLVPFTAEGRRIFPPTTDELVARAPIVCNGEVIELENTLEKGMAVLPHYERNFSIPVEFWKAKIKVLSTFKGKVPDEIELRFPQIDQHPLNDKTTIISDGPIQISLQPKGRYRFFLKAVPGQKWYVGVVDGDFDDGYAVQPLEDKESDNSPLFLKEEALKLATDYVRLLKPDAKVSEWSIEASELGLSRWNVTFWWPPAHIHDFDPSAEIGIEGNRDIDPRSWVSDGTSLRIKSEARRRRARIPSLLQFGS